MNQILYQFVSSTTKALTCSLSALDKLLVIIQHCSLLAN